MPAFHIVMLEFGLYLLLAQLATNVTAGTVMSSWVLPPGWGHTAWTLDLWCHSGASLGNESPGRRSVSVWSTPPHPIFFFVCLFKFLQKGPYSPSDETVSVGQGSLLGQGFSVGRRKSACHAGCCAHRRHQTLPECLFQIPWVSFLIVPQNIWSS